jgi:hypothetical protein
MTISPDTVVVATDRRKDPLVCDHCGLVSWRKAPGLLGVYQAILARGDTTTADVTRDCGIAISNATDKIKRLVSMGLVKLVHSGNHPTGGRINTYAAVVAAAPKPKRARKAAA